MKKLLFLIIMAAVGVSATAKPISKSSAAAKAAKYMFGMSSQSKGMWTPGTGRIQSVLATDAADEAYYAFNAADGKGFVIISGDDEMPELVGYSKSGSLSADDMSDGLKYYLKCYTKYVRQTREGLLPARKTVVDNSYTPVVDTLITTLWDQSYPYNKYAPEEKNYFQENYNSRFPIGCVALAFAQVMNYWQWPKAINSEVDTLTAKYSVLDKEGMVLQPNIPTYICPNANGNTPYDWKRIGEKILTYDNANGVDDYEAKADAVGVLLRDVAYGLTMEWDNGGGGTFSQPGVLTSYFGYSMEATSLLANGFEGNNKSQEWIDLIKADLDKHQPIIYNGSGSAGGHCFIFDGYDTGNRVHVNWGWGGQDNGWFDVYYLYISHDEGSYDFSNNNYMIYNLHPNYDGKEEHMKPSRQSVSYIGADIQYAIGEYKNFASISKTPFIAPFNSSLTIWPSTFINCWLSGIGYDVRLTRVSKETGETETCTVSNALNSQGAEFIRCNTIHTVPTDTDDVKKLPDGLYTYTVEYSTFNDAQEQTGWFTPLLFQNTPSNTFYLEKKDKQCIFYETSDIYNVIDYKYIDTDDALGWINIHSNKDINSITVDSNIIFSCNIDVPFFKMPATEMTEENCIVQTSIIREDGTLYYKNSTNLECNSAETEPNTGEELYSAFASNSHPGTFESPGTYTLVVEVPLFGYSIKKEFTVGDKQESGITSITPTHSPSSSAVYTLSGQRVTSNYKGIVISNGKKKVVR